MSIYKCPIPPLMAEAEMKGQSREGETETECE